MSVWRKTKANASRRSEAVITQRIMQLVLDRVVAEMRRIADEAEAKMTIGVFYLANPSADGAEIWPWSLYAEPPQ